MHVLRHVDRYNTKYVKEDKFQVRVSSFKSATFLQKFEKSHQEGKH